MMFDLLRGKKPNILVIGDLMIDSYLWGNCNRISPEAPVQIIDINNQTEVLGGAGNVLNNLYSLGANVSVISVIGNCPNSDNLKSLLSKININLDYLVTQKNRITSKKTRIISSQQQVIRFDQETIDNIDLVSEKKIIEIFKNKVTDFDIVILSDYHKGVLTESLCQELIKIANHNKVKIIVDPKGKDYSKYKNAYLLPLIRKRQKLQQDFQLLIQKLLVLQ